MAEVYSLGSWIRQRRRTLDMTQQELAYRVNCSLSTIGKIESDQRRPSRQMAELLAEHLGIPENQRERFLKVARGLKAIDQMTTLPIHQESLFQIPIRGGIFGLPVPLAPLIGRKPELAEILRLLALPECRLLSITGPGGVGKTKLAIHVAHELNTTSQPFFPDGICFVPLASVMVVENIPKVIAQAIRFDLSGPLNPEEQLINYLREKTLLLLVDNLEHLLEGAGTFSRVLEQAPGVKLLMTSRERLNLQSEWVFDLQGLPVPPLDVVEGLEEYSSAKLFLDCARRARTSFSLREDDRPVVARICHLLDGIPLGIELAATWVRTLSLGEIAAEIARDPDFLTSVSRDVPERHRSLRIVFDHSWKLLSFTEQHALRQLSVFRGGFTWEAAIAVADSPLPILNSLINKSLLRRVETGRFDLHELVRIYATECLAEEPEEQASVREYHSRFFMSMVYEVGLDLQSNRQKEALAKLSPEMANIRTAWNWAVTHSQIELLREAAWSLWYFFDLRNYYREAEAAFGEAADIVRRTLEARHARLKQAVRANYDRALGQFLMHQAYFAMRLGWVDEAEALCQASISVLRNADYPEALAHALTYYAVLNWNTGKLDQAWRLLQESLPLSREHGPSWQIALFTSILGNVAFERGEYEYSYELLDEALEHSQVIGDPRLIGFISAYLGRAALKLQRTAEIEEILKEGAYVTQDSGDRFGYGLNLEQLARIAQARGDFSSSRQLFETSVDLFQEIGDAWSLAQVLTSWGDFRRLLEELPQAEKIFKQAIRLSLDVRASLITLSALVGLAMVYAQEGKVETALEIASYVMDHPASTQDTRTSAHQLRQDLEAHLTSKESERIYQRERADTLEEFARIYL